MVDCTNTMLQAALLALLATAMALDPPNPKKDAALPPCGACTNLVSSFEAGMERTKRYKTDGGDTAWEEKHKQSYATSEVRLAEITEELCRGVGRGETQCHQNAGEWEEALEEWWGLAPETRSPLREWLCVDKLEMCCPQDHYGPKCQPCAVLGLGDKVCGGNGKCKGSGTRKGNGKCSCNKEYGGEKCDQCSGNHYESFRDETKLLCSPCHKACEGHCTGSGPKSCTKCKGGFNMNTEHGCLDIDECQVGKECEGQNKFCVNTEGSFKCMACDKACNGCESDGPDNCFECANGFKKGKNDVCVADKNAGRVFTIDNTRYFTYAGLVIATCIIFHKNWVVASLVGGFVAIYISCTELYLANNTLNGDLQPTPGTLDAIQQQFAQGMPGMGDMGDIPPPEDMM